jgi:cGMP-dependent protein kinase
MGCIPSKKQKQVKIHGFSSSLAIIDDQRKIRLSILSELKKGMTIGAKARLSHTTLPQQNAFERHECDVDCLTSEILKKSPSPEELSELQQTLRSHFLFKDLEDTTLKEIIMQMNYYLVQKNEFIFKQADPGFNFFIIASGSVEIIVNQKHVKFMERGDCFGELALIHNSGRRATAKAANRTRLWGLGRDVFKETISESIRLKYKENEEFLQSLEVFKALPRAKLEILLASAITESFEENERIFMTGDLNSIMYIVKTGKVNIMKGTEKINTLGKGEYFGEISMIYNVLRNASAFAASKCKILCFTENTLIKVFGSRLQGFLYFNAIRIAFARDFVLKELTNLQVTRLLPLFSTENFEGRFKIYPSKFIYLVLWGQVSEVDSSVIYKVFDTIKSQEFLNDDLSLNSSECILCKISRNDLEKELASPLQNTLESNRVLKNMSKILFLTYIPENKLEELSRMVEIRTFEENELVFQEGNDADYFYIVKSGSIQIEKNGLTLTSLKKDDYFGERAFLFNEKRAASARSLEKSECWVIKKEVFLSLLNEKFLFYLKQKIAMQEKDAELKDLKILKKIGEGNFSEIFIVLNQKNNLNYSLKTIKKQDIDRYDLLERLKREKKIHLDCSFPFISTLIKTLTDKENVYFLSEYLQGPSLSNHLESKTALTMKQAKFFASAILLSLEYLHNSSIVHREITPESFIIDAFGYPVMADLSNAKKIENRTFTILGNPFYIAPEVIIGLGYSFSADLWSLGITIFELLFGVVPFGYGKEDPYEIYQIILNDSHKYPIFIKESQKPSGIIEKLLSKDPTERGTADDIKRHEWFLGVDWDDLIGRNSIAEFIPEGKFFESLSEDQAEPLATTGNEYECDWDSDFL